MKAVPISALLLALLVTGAPVDGTAQGPGGAMCDMAAATLFKSALEAYGVPELGITTGEAVTDAVNEFRGRIKARRRTPPHDRWRKASSAPPSRAPAWGSPPVDSR